MEEKNFSKWGIDDNIPVNELYDRVINLEKKYKELIFDLKYLQDENVETTNILYEVMNCIDVLDSRIDNLVKNFKIN